VSRDGHCAAPAGDAPEAGEHQGAVIVATFPMPAGLVFDWHTHTDHQLAWAASGVLTVRTGNATWVLPPTRALWIPAGLRHETLSSGAATMRSLYIRPDRSPVTWTAPTPVTASPLLAEMIGYLGGGTLDGAARARPEAVLADLLQPVAMTTIDLRMPDDDRARQVALAGEPRGQADARCMGPRSRRQRADAGPGVPGRHRDTVRPLADAAADSGRTARARRR
jgi:quercetin dioxygenase-like cupin family protein